MWTKALVREETTRDEHGANPKLFRHALLAADVYGLPQLDRNAQRRVGLSLHEGLGHSRCMQTLWPFRAKGQLDEQATHIETGAIGYRALP